MDKGALLRYYKRKDIQDIMVEHAIDKEVGVRYGDGFGKRPDILKYPKEVIEWVKNGVTSFHVSEEKWSNPLELHSDLNRKQLDEIREGWDLLLDIDCKIFEYSKISAILIIRFLKYCGVKNVSCKFSGGKGFHIGVPFESFPSRIKGLETKSLFPEAPKKIAFYIKENIKEELGKRILELENGDFGKVKKKTGLDKEIIRYEKNEYGDDVAKLDAEPFLEIDTILIASRHLYRMPYSLHEGSGLASVVIDPDKVAKFEKPMAKPEIVKVNEIKFMDREVSESGSRLLLQALDFEVNPDEIDYADDIKKDYEEIKIEGAIKEEFFPPCIKKLLAGVADGRKRGVFILMNFLGKIGWEKKEIEQYILKWNKENNTEPLRNNYITSQLRYFKPGDKLPPNCNNEGYYKGMGICLPDNLCQKIKNPVNYTIVKWKWRDRGPEKKEEKKQKETKNQDDTEQKNESQPKNQAMDLDEQNSAM